jgi:flagellar biosynthesis regulator FlbT
MDQPAPPVQSLPPTTQVNTQKLRDMVTALQKATDLMETHIAAGQQTVPARALYFILRDAGFGSSPRQTQEVKQAPKQEQKELTNQLHHNYGMRR